MKKQVLTVFMAGILTASMGMTALAGWEQEGNNWKYNDNGAYAANGWYWIDGNNDGIAESYYFDNTGILARDTTVEGYTVNADGAWTVNGEIQTRTDVGVVQTQGVASGNTGVNHGANYDPAHPLAGKIDEWNLRLRKTSATAMGTMTVIGTWNVHAMLTGQMDMYEEPTGYGADEQKATEQELYTWFCNWLNGMDFANMSEMQRAQAITEVMKGVQYSTADTSDYKGSHFYDHTDEYRVLISRKGICEEFAMTTMSLAKALGLKASVSGSGWHAICYVRVDGKIYESNNGLLFLNAPVYTVPWMEDPNYVWSSDY